MGFRNPITTAVDPVARQTASDALALAGTKITADQINGRTITGGTFQTAPATTSQVPAAGAILQEATDENGFPYGALVFADGIAADTTSYVMGKADYNPRAQAATLGGGLTLQSGKYNGVNGPSLQVKVESASDGTGSVYPVVRVNSAGGRARTDAPWIMDEAWSGVPISGTGLTVWPGAGNPLVRRDGAGNVHWEGLVALSASLAAGASVNLPIPAPFAPTVEAWRMSMAASSGFGYLGPAWFVARTSGVLQLSNTTGAAMPAGSGFALYFSYPQL